MSSCPKLRIEGFTDAWEQRKLGDIGSARSGVGFPDAEQGGTEGIPFFKVSDMNNVGNENELVSANNYVSDEQIKRKRWNVITDVPAIFFAKVGAAVMLNRKRLVRFPFLLDNNTMAYIFDKKTWDCEFGKTLFETIDLTKLTQTGALPSYNASDVENIEIYLPNIEEQKAIGAFFLQLDNLITLHQRKSDALKNAKKYFLKNMFPSEGEKFPKLRLEGFTDAWEQRKLGQVSVRVQGNDGEMGLPTLTISASEGWMKQEDRFSRNIAGKEQKNYTLLHKGELSYNHGNSKLAKYGTVFSLESYEKALVPRVYHSFKLKEGNPKFIEYYFATKIPDRELGKLVSSGARMDGLLNISFDAFMGINVVLPSVSEQDKIATFLENLDNLITLHQRKCDALKNAKKFFLQNMFV